ncbi:uroporphyrinogen-III C-methyltransferase [Salinibacterium sp. SYSU T00001]|uniref:uroporphyrinogen-III C-methyltransferase n=1 Tax=Homoserinimonas sedimenticola TaxID=2986805 RepID=UPI00223654CC|nr:uroporphyrinogen-III C-methyltransferase [Salinibacterium sedimenticola]MCW4384857.1 uroporphyrinogen-III C-methyltransferase [Salinibacterium sedimenticola]
MVSAGVGRVTLVGGGPGAEHLMTVGALRALADADVVLYDRLAPHERLAELAPRATLINVGKLPGHHPISQRGIELLMVDHARAGAHVVRLKGGDPYVFGRGSEEVIACREAGIPVEVIPGVTSAISVPASAGIPLTHRGVSRLFTVVSGHAPLSEEELEHLAGLGGTLVVLMGVSSLPHLAAGLQRHGAAGDLPVAIIERGYSRQQKTTVSSLADVVTDATLAGVSAPAVLVVGEVVRLAHAGAQDAAEVMRSAELLVENA